jgi:hypothetical protein
MGHCPEIWDMPVFIKRIVTDVSTKKVDNPSLDKQFDYTTIPLLGSNLGYMTTVIMHLYQLPSVVHFLFLSRKDRDGNA